MSQASGVRSGLPYIPVPAAQESTGKLWKRWQVIYILGRTVFLVGFFLLMEHRHGRDISLLLGTLLDNTVLVRAVVLLAVGTLLELALFAVLNHWQERRPQSGVAWRALTGLVGESLLWVVCFLPAFFVMFVGPALVEIVSTLSSN